MNSFLAFSQILTVIISLLLGSVAVPVEPIKPNVDEELHQKLVRYINNTDLDSILQIHQQIVEVPELYPKTVGELARTLFHYSMDSASHGEMDRAEICLQKVEEIASEEYPLELLRIVIASGRRNYQLLEERIADYRRQYQLQPKALVSLAMVLLYRVEFFYSTRIRNILEEAILASPEADLPGLAKDIIEFQNERHDDKEATRFIELLRLRGISTSEVEVLKKSFSKEVKSEDSGLKLFLSAVVLVLVWKFFSAKTAIPLLILYLFSSVLKLEQHSWLLITILLMTLLLINRFNLIFFLGNYYYGSNYSGLAISFFHWMKKICNKEEAKTLDLQVVQMLIQDKKIDEAKEKLKTMVDSCTTEELRLMDILIAMSEKKYSYVYVESTKLVRTQNTVLLYQLLIDSTMRLGLLERSQMIVELIRTEQANLVLLNLRLNLLIGNVDKLQLIIEQISPQVSAYPYNLQSEYYVISSFLLVDEAKIDSLICAWRLYKPNQTALKLLLFQLLKIGDKQRCSKFIDEALCHTPSLKKENYMILASFECGTNLHVLSSAGSDEDLFSLCVKWRSGELLLEEAKEQYFTNRENLLAKLEAHRPQIPMVELVEEISSKETVLEIIWTRDFLDIWLEGFFLPEEWLEVPSSII